MVKVYFEQPGYAELVAYFDSKETYHACLPALEQQAKENNFEMVTESVVEIELTDVDDIVNQKTLNF